MTVLLPAHTKYLFCTKKKPPALFGANQYHSIACYDSASFIWLSDGEGWVVGVG